MLQSTKIVINKFNLTIPIRDVQDLQLQVNREDVQGCPD